VSAVHVQLEETVVHDQQATHAQLVIGPSVHHVSHVLSRQHR
jgi:hypothetical protein